MSSENVDSFSEDQNELHRIKFYILLILEIPSILICLLLFLFFLIHRDQFQVRQNQALYLLLIVNFIQVTCDLPMVMHYYRLGRISPSTPGYCTWWTFLEYTLNAANEFLMATICIQRHFLIFRSQLFQNRLKCFLFHHFPLLICLIYPLILYLIIVVFYPCDGTQWNYSANICGLANCYLLNSKILGLFDWIINNGSPIIIISLANLTLIIRVIRQKLRHNQLITWKKQRRMTLQLFSISCLYFFTWSPNLFIGFVQQVFSPTFLIDIQFNYTFDLTYLISLLLPWIYLGVFPEFLKWIRRCLKRGTNRHNHIAPSHMTNPQTDERRKGTSLPK